MIRRQSDTIVARILVGMNSKSEALALGSRGPSYTAPVHQDLTKRTKNETSAVSNCNLISALYHVHISSPSQIHFLIGSLQCWYRYEISKSRRILEANLRYRCPSWLSYRDWDARYLKEVSRWEVQLQTHPILPPDHDIFGFAKTGNLAGIPHMLAKSPSYVAARQNSGCTPLHVSGVIMPWRN